MFTGYSGERLILTLWIGALWAIGYLAVPMAFVNLDVTVAGNYAGKLFFAVNVLSVISAVILLISRLFIFGLLRFHLFWRNWLLLLLLFISLVFLSYLQPEMQEIKSLDWQNSIDLTQQFDELHQLSESLYLLMSLLGLMLVLSTDKQAEAESHGEK